MENDPKINVEGSQGQPPAVRVLAAVPDEKVGRIVKAIFGFLFRKDVLPYIMMIVTGVGGFLARKTMDGQSVTAEPPAAKAAPIPMVDDELKFNARAGKASSYIIESLNYVCHLDKGESGAGGAWGGPGSILNASVHISYTYRAIVDITGSDEGYGTDVKQGTLMGFFSTVPVAREREPPYKRVSVDLSFPLKKGDFKTIMTGADYKYTVPVETQTEMDTVAIQSKQFFLHYPKTSDYIREVIITIESSTLTLSEGMFAVRPKGQPTKQNNLEPQATCLKSYCGEFWRPVVTASDNYIEPGTDFGLRVAWQ